MAKICFYCGKELLTEERCSCRASTASSKGGASPGTSGSSGGSSRYDSAKSARQSASSDRAAKEESARQAKERAKEREKEHARAKTGNARQTQQARKPAFDWRSFLLKLMTSSGYASSDPLPKKIGYSMLQTLIRPMTAIETFVQRQDMGLSIFYLALFSLATGLVSLRFFEASILSFAEGTFLGLVIALFLNGLFILTLRFLAKMRFSLAQMLSTFSAPAFFMALLFLFAGAGRTNLLSLVLSIGTGVVIGSLLQFLSLKSMTRQSSDQLIVYMVFVYILFSSLLGIVLSLMVPATAVI